MKNYYPEGGLIGTQQNRSYIKDREGMNEAFAKGAILEARALLCTGEHQLIVDLPCGRGIITREEGAVGITEGTTRDIALISRVGKPVCFKIARIEEANGETVYILSRRAAQQDCIDECLSKLIPGDIIPARVTHLEKFGCFVDIGCGIPSLIPIDSISVSRINHPNDRFYNGQLINAVVKGREGEHILLSHKELLGTWEENAAKFSVGQTVSGIVRSVESYGIFVELAPNLAGLAELRDNITAGMAASVFVKAIIPDKMKVKLIIVDAFENMNFPAKFTYFKDSGHIDSWIYSTPESSKQIETFF